MRELVDTLVTGILIGAVFSLFSCGLTIIFGITRVVNFAQGDFITVGMYGIVLLYSLLHIPFYASLPIVLVASFAIGLIVYRAIISRTYRFRQTSAEREQSQMVITLGISILITNIILAIAGPNPRSVNALTGRVLADGIVLPDSQLVAFGIVIVIFALLFIAIKFTRFGRAIAATVDDRQMASAFGVNTERVFAIAFGTGIAMAGLAGAILSTYYTVTPTAGEDFLIVAFIVVIMGGLGNVPGTIISGFVAAIVESVTASYVSLQLEDIGIYALFIVILMIRPQGLFGVHAAADSL